MLKKIDNKTVFTKEKYLQTVANWKWFITSGGAKARGYIIPEYNPNNGKIVNMQKHKASDITACHMILNNLIRGRDPWRGFADRKKVDHQEKAQDNQAYRDTATRMGFAIQFALSSSERLKNVTVAKNAMHDAGYYADSIAFFTSLGKPFGLSAKTVMTILEKADSK